MQPHRNDIMRLHRNLTFAVIDSIRDIFNEGVYADKAVEKALKRDKRWGARDRKFVAETIYEIVRWNRLYAEIAEVKIPYDRDNIWRIFSVWCILRGIALPDWNQIGRCTRKKNKRTFCRIITHKKIQRVCSRLDGCTLC